MNRKYGAILAGVVTFMIGAQQLVSSQGQQVDDASKRFEFVVIQSFDAKYLGDTPGHFGRGKIGQEQPDLALGDPVFHEDRLVGKVTGISWDRIKENLEVEFDPEPFELDEHGRPAALNRIAVGERLWIPRGGKHVENPLQDKKLPPRP
jgi:hypothetical protein